MNKENKWRQLVAEQNESGMTIKNWCDEKGIPQQTFYKWKKKFKDEVSKENVTFVPAVIEEPKSKSIILSVGNVTLELDDNFNEQLLLRVMNTLNKSC